MAGKSLRDCVMNDQPPVTDRLAVVTRLPPRRGMRWPRRFDNAAALNPMDRSSPGVAEAFQLHLPSHLCSTKAAAAATWQQMTTHVSASTFVKPSLRLRLVFQDLREAHYSSPKLTLSTKHSWALRHTDRRLTEIPQVHDRFCVARVSNWHSAGVPARRHWRWRSGVEQTNSEHRSIDAVDPTPKSVT